MFKKVILIIAICLLILSCGNKDKQQPVNMQDVSREMDFQPDDTDLERDLPGYSTHTEPPATHQPPATNTQQQQQTRRPNTNLAPESGSYTAQLLAAKDRSKVEVHRRKLSNAGYETVIQEAVVNGETMYRLRLSGSFSRAYAEQLAKEIQARFPEYRDYWITRN
jgi:cell division septation protein DedD